jgi:DNA-binding NarL/FixJ family response regulator
MSFDGDLEHLPIVDVIQLLHATGKSGTLTLKSLKGESQLVFHDGCIVSANHVNNSVRIGQILLDMGLIQYEELESALREQQKAGPERKPIIQTMIEAGRIQTEAAYHGLEILIEMTIVEVLTWTKGTFSLDVDKSLVSDEYRYIPEQLKQKIQLNTQSVLMDALRIYDERKRDGTLTSEAMFGTPPAIEPEPAAVASGPEISVVDLGLDELDVLERKIPQVFSGLTDLEPDTAAKRLKLELAGVPAEEQQRLFRYLDSLAGARQPANDATGVILLSSDKLVRECVAAVCGQRFLLATDDASALDPVIDQSLSKGRVPLLLLDAGEPSGRGSDREAMVALLQQKRERHPELCVIVLTCPGDFQLTTRALQAGINAVLPRSSREERPESFIADTIDCTQVLDHYLKSARVEPGQGLLQQFKRQFQSISEQREPAEVTFLLLQAVSAFFDRAVTLVVVRSELIAERGIGLSEAGAVSSVKLRIPSSKSSLFQKALAGEYYYGDADAAVRGTLFESMGVPASPKILLLPVKSFGRVIALIYGDFAARAGGDPQPELLEILAQHAGLVIDNALYRKRCAQKATT